MDYLILNSKKWDFQIWIILIQIKCFEQLAPTVRSTSMYGVFDTSSPLGGNVVFQVTCILSREAILKIAICCTQEVQ